ncbi:MAG: PilN domain-containing protein [Deltaproteobacteria bacterium]|nr:PilN domain-containing protein [Deltaproteobacteria bacterium]
MIRINLLPVRAAKKKESVRFQLTVAGLVTVSVIAISVAAYFKLGSDASLLKMDIDSAGKELQDLKRQVGELSKLKEQKRVVESKLGVVKRLEGARTGPVELFTKVAGSVPQRAWIYSLQDRGKVITVNGYAGKDEDVAEFMRGFEGYGAFKKVELIVAQRSKTKTAGRDLVEFTIVVERQ